MTDESAGKKKRKTTQKKNGITKFTYVARNEIHSRGKNIYEIDANCKRMKAM